MHSKLEGTHLYVEISSGEWYHYELLLLDEGSFNHVYTISTPSGSDPHVVIRIAKVRAKSNITERSEKHNKELETGILLAIEGICPTIFMNLHVSLTGAPHGQDLTFGTAIERYDCSLATVQSCPILMRQVFVEGNGESLLVDLYTRAGAMVRCIDTKPDNVVVRLPKGSAEQRSRLSLALIDVDPTFCDEKAASKYYQLHGESPLRNLSRVLYTLGEHAKLSESALLVAAMSLLVHVTVSALDYILFERGFGFPYIEITLVLMKSWHQVWSMLYDDENNVDGRYISERTSVNSVIQSHWRNATFKGNFDLSDPDQLYMFLASVVVCRESRILRACTKQRKPDLYRNMIVLTLGDTREQYKKKLMALEMSESIESWEAIVGTAALSTTQCGMRYCTFHPKPASMFGRIRRGKKEKEGNSKEKSREKKRDSKRTEAKGDREMRKQ
jgi:hypothetical protein